MPTPSCCDRLTLRVVLLKVSPLVARLIFGTGRPFSGRASRRSAARFRLERTSVLQLPHPGPRDWPTTPLANSPPARVPASAPRKVLIHLRLPRSMGMGDSRSGYRTWIGRSLAAPLLGRPGRNDQQAHDEEAANALDTPRSTSTAVDPDKGA